MVDQNCRRHQCDSLSKCVPSWTGYSCSCPFGFWGPTCGQRKSEASRFERSHVVIVMCVCVGLCTLLVIQMAREG